MKNKYNASEIFFVSDPSKFDQTEYDLGFFGQNKKKIKQKENTSKNT